MNRLALSVLSVLFVVFGFSAQRVKEVSGEYLYPMGQHESFAQAEVIAIHKAKVNALAEEFGTLLEQTNLTMVKGGKSEFHSLGMSDVRGIWLGDTKTPEVKKIMGEDGILYFQAKVWGKAREIITEPIDLDVRLLRGGFTADYESEVFKHMDDYFVSFRSPVDGYLAIYLMSEANPPEFSRLLPYYTTSDRSYRIKANKDYLFFTLKHLNEGDDSNSVLEYIMATEKDVAYCKLYVIFSPNEFTHPLEKDGGRVVYGRQEYQKPVEIDYKHMQEWLIKSRGKDKDMQVVRKDITIRKK